MEYIVTFFEYGIWFYSLMIIGSYILIAIVSGREVTRYCEEKEVNDHRALLSTEYAPSIAIIAPAYNESATIIPNIRSLLSLHYVDLTVIVVNDGSKDDTRDKVIEAYNLEQVDFAYNEQIDTQKVRGVYKSKNRAFRKLLFVDKENGGKADAINVGVNIADAEYFACIDVDCIIEPDAFLKMAKPFMEASEKRIIAVGGIVWLTNDADIENGKLNKVVSPRSFVPRMQVIEYFRAFLIGRTAWAKFNGLLLISGAFGVFDREIAIAAGGYNHNTVGEDMELVMRMHAYMREREEPYEIAYLPDPLCWTEAPADFNILGRQRNRWTRGTIECLLLHKKMLLNPKYGVLGMVSYPYWMLAEWLAPFVEFFGITFLIIMGLCGLANWAFCLSLMLLLYAFSICLSMYAIYIQEISFNKYENKKDILHLLLTAAIEPFYFHPRVVWWALKGNYDFVTGKNTGWGEMVRQGFDKKD